MTSDASARDLIITGGRIHTGNPSAPWAEAFAVRDGTLIAVGDHDQVRAAAAGPHRTVWLDGAFAMPGLVDVHNHHAVAGRAELFELGFSPADDLPTILTAVRRRAATAAAGTWIVGGSWGSNLLGVLNTSEALRQLDAVSHGHPVVLTDDSHHNRWANTAARQLAGITADDRSPGVLRDPGTAEITGVLLEAAGKVVSQAHERIAPLTDEQHQQCSRRGIAILNSFGVTCFQDAGVGLPTLRALQALDDRDELDAWVVTSMLVNDEIFGADPVGPRLLNQGGEFRTAHHRPDFVKIFLDGVPPARTGAFLQPYLPDTVHGRLHCGDTLVPAAALLDWLRDAAQRGLSAKIHCTGDAAVRVVLDAVQTLRAAGFTDTLFQIAHGQFVAPQDIPRFAALGVTADISPFLWYPGVIPDAIAEVLPAERASRMQPNRDLIDAGALVAGGSDWPVCVSPNPWHGIAGLVTRADPTGVAPGTLWPEQALTLTEALAVFTANGAAAMGLGAVTGALTVGRSADFVVLDRDPFEVDTDALADTRTLQTWVRGRQVFTA